jgi:hypothetical protein
MRFQRRVGPPPFLNRADQFRLLGLCGLLFLTILAFQHAADPETWRWLVVEDQEPAVGETEELTEISHLIHNESRGLRPDEFLGSVNAAAAEPELTDEAVQKSSAGATPPAWELDPELFTPVLDSTIGWRSREEIRALEAVINTTRQFRSADLLPHAQTDVSYRFISQQPGVFRGKLVHLNGILRRLEPFRESQDAATEEVPAWVGWVFTPDSGNKPWMVVAASLPGGLEPSTSLERPVAVTGYFFKRFGYETAEQQLNVAPLLIAPGFELLPLPEEIEQRSNLATYTIAGILLTAMLLLGLLGWSFYRSDQRFRQTHLGQLAAGKVPPNPADLAALRTLEVSNLPPLLPPLGSLPPADLEPPEDSDRAAD